MFSMPSLIDLSRNSAVVGLGASAGAALRYVTNEALAPRLRAPIYGITFVNIAGCFLFGTIAATTKDPTTKLALTTGFCGGLTTFSTYSSDAVGLIRAGHTAHFAAFVALNNAACIGAAALGWFVGARMLRFKR